MDTFHNNNKFNNFNESDDFTCTWFDKELTKTFGIDIYSLPFNKDIGYEIIRMNNIEILVLRMEDMDEHFNEAIALFINGNSPIQMKKKNIGKDKKYSRAFSPAESAS